MNADDLRLLAVPTLEYAFDVRVDLGAPLDHGVTSEGHRRVVPILGGEISGPFTAEILPGGADWQVIRPDGTIEIDGRYTARTADGALLLLHAKGLRTGTPELLARLAHGAAVPPNEYYFRTTVQIETSAPEHAQMQRALFVAYADRQQSTVLYRAYRVS